MSAQPLAWIERAFPQRCIGTNGDVACTRIGTFWAVNAHGGRLGPLCKRHANRAGRFNDTTGPSCTESI